MLSPHFLSSQVPSQPDSFGDFTLKPGEVTDVIYPEDPRSIGKKLVEYLVEVQFLDPQTRTGRTRPYRATLGNPMAGVTEREVLVLRADKPNQQTGIGRGSKVVVACLNGEQNSAIILWGLRDTASDSDLGLRDSGVLYRWDANGVSIAVGTDGSMAMTVTGPKNKDNETTAEPDRVGSFRLAANGSASLGLGSSPTSDQDDYVLADAADRKIKVSAQAGLHVGKATDSMPLFSTYRQAEGTLHAQLQAQMTICQAALTTSAAALSAAATTMLLPVVGPILASPGIAQVGAQLSLVAQAFLQMQLAIQSFEARAETFLSRLNKND